MDEIIPNFGRGVQKFSLGDIWSQSLFHETEFFIFRAELENIFNANGLRDFKFKDF